MYITLHEALSPLASDSVHVTVIVPVLPVPDAVAVNDVPLLENVIPAGTLTEYSLPVKLVELLVTSVDASLFLATVPLVVLHSYFVPV